MKKAIQIKIEMDSVYGDYAPSFATVKFVAWAEIHELGFELVERPPYSPDFPRVTSFPRSQNLGWRAEIF